VNGVDGILVDLGVSSHQLDDPERGFSFQADGPLDMRMDERVEVTAADLVNGLEEAQLADIFFRYGEERSARRIAREIVARRERRKFETTRQLAALVERVKPRRGRAHPATQVFQALRIAVNDEIKALEDFLEATTRWLRPGGTLVVITFHSLEDRIVKHFIKDRCNAWTDRPEWPEPRPNPLHCFAPVTGKPIPPSDEEMRRNPRARSAKLRVAKRIATPSPEADRGEKGEGGR
jgi:16S rRNA (cytosine1402-N4)-methyltransferase